MTHKEDITEPLRHRLAVGCAKGKSPPNARRGHRRRWLWILLVLAVVQAAMPLLASTTVPAYERKVHFDIPAGNLSKTIRKFGAQAHVLVTADSVVLDRIRTQTVRGELLPRCAMRRLLGRPLPVIVQWDFNNKSIVLYKSPPNRHYELESGDVTVKLNEFSRQSDIQVLFNVLQGMITSEVYGDYDVNEALFTMLRGLGLEWDFVNDRTIAVTPARINCEQPPRGGLWAAHVGATQADIAEVVVHGDQVSTGWRPSPGSRELHIDRAELDDSGVVTTQEFLRSRPEFFGGGANESTSLGAEQATNSGQGVGGNLRALGSAASVVVVNGRPIAPSGTGAAFTDVSNIPLSMVDHIEIIPEGGTALYGGEAVGGVVNFVLKNKIGSEMQAHTGLAQGRTLGEQQFSVNWGAGLGDAATFFAAEYYRRDALAAADRALATSDLRPWGGSNWDKPFGNPGTLVVSGQTWAIPRGQDGRSLSPGDVQAGTVSLHDTAEGSDILPSQKRVDLYSHSDLPLTENTTLTADVLWGDRLVTKTATGVISLLTVPTTNPFYFNPTGKSQPVQIMYGFLSDLGPEMLTGDVQTGNVSIGFAHVSSSGWNTRGEVAYTYETQDAHIDNMVNPVALGAALADPDPATAFNPFGDGSHTGEATLAQIRGKARLSLSSRYWFARAVADRTLLPIPGGDCRVIVGSDLRLQSLTKTSVAPGEQTYDDQYRRVAGAFVDLRIPIVGAMNSVQGIAGLEISAAGRIEHYSDAVGWVSTPSYSIAWSPINSLRIRSTYASVFRAPTLDEISPVGVGSELTSVRNSNSPAIALVAFGGNSYLRPETGRSWSLGFDWQPQSVDGVTLALTHWRIHLDNVVGSLSLLSNVLGDPRFASFVTPQPTYAQRAAVCYRGTFYGGDLNNCLTAQVPIVDARNLNVSRVRTEGFDLAAKYALETAIGEFEFGLNATRTTIFSQAFSAADALVNVVNTDHNPLSLRARGSVVFRRGLFRASGAVNYAGHYRDVDSVPQRTVGAWTTLDAQISYQFLSETIFKDLTLSLSVQNALGSIAPFLNNSIGLGYDQENVVPTGRQVALTARKRF